MLTRISIILFILSGFIFLFQTGEISYARYNYVPDEAVISLDSPILKPTYLEDTFKDKKKEFSKALEQGRKITKLVIDQQDVIVKQTNKVDMLVSNLEDCDTVYIVEKKKKKSFFSKLFGKKD